MPRPVAVPVLTSASLDGLILLAMLVLPTVAMVVGAVLVRRRERPKQRAWGCVLLIVGFVALLLAVGFIALLVYAMSEVAN